MKTFYKKQTLLLTVAFIIINVPKSFSQLSLDLNGAGNMVTTSYSVNPLVGYTVEFDMNMNVLQNYNAGVTFTCSNLPFPVDMYVNATGDMSLLSGDCTFLSGAPATGLLTASVWNHYAYVYDPSTSELKLYINGVVVASIAFTQSISATSFIIGDRSDGVTNADAKYDNLKVWSVVRTPSEIISDMTYCFTGLETGLDVLYHFEEGLGTTIFDAALGNGAQNGTITGSVSWATGVNNNSIGNLTTSACNSYTSPSGNYTWNVSGTYMDTIPNSIGCDSIITVNLTIDNMPFSTAFSNGYTTGYSLYKGMFLNEMMGWTAYYAWDIPASYIAKTTDGGLTFTSTGIPSSYIGDVTFVDANNGFACGGIGSGNMIASSTDGGVTWTPVSYPTVYLQQLNRIVFNDALNGAAAGYGGAMYTTNNGGASWNYTAVNAGNTVFNDISYVNNNNIWSVGYEYPGVQGLAYQSTDGGATWTQMFSSLTVVNFTAVKFVSPLKGFICGGGVLFSTTDGGTTWTSMTVGAAGDYFTDVDFGAGKYWLSGGNGSTSAPALYNSLDAITWTPVSISPATSTVAYNVMIPSGNKVFINGDRLIIGNNSTLFNSTVVNPIICSGDPSLLVAQGGITYSWSNGDTNDSTTVNPTSTSSYTVTGSYNSCSLTNTLSVTVLQPSASNDIQSACDSYLWIDGNSYNISNSSATFTLTNAVGCDSVITLNLTVVNSNAGTDVQTACNLFTWIDGNTYSSSTSTPTFMLINSAGCDSLVTLNLTINSVDATVTLTSPTITSNEVGATYQWVNCATSFSVIAGETNQNFTATSNGSYAVVVTKTGCVDTSACQTITGLGMNEFVMENIQVYPNPTTGIITINLNYLTAIYNLTDAAGKIIFSNTAMQNKTTLDLSNLERGIYFLRISGQGFSENVKISLVK